MGQKARANRTPISKAPQPPLFASPSALPLNPNWGRFSLSPTSMNSPMTRSSGPNASSPHVPTTFWMPNILDPSFRIRISTTPSRHLLPRKCFRRHRYFRRHRHIPDLQIRIFPFHRFHKKPEAGRPVLKTIHSSYVYLYFMINNSPY